jgi:hypothetical protein
MFLITMLTNLILSLSRRSFLMLLIFLLSLPSYAAQHLVVAKIIEQSNCGTDHYFSGEQIHAKNWSEIFSNDLNKMLEGVELKPEIVKAKQVKDLNLIPVNDCVLRGNRNYCQSNNEALLKSFKVSRAITMDETVHKKYASKTSLNYAYLPVIPKKYPKGQSVQSILQALNYLSEASPENKVYISCFFGKHRTGLIVGMYQFLRNYGADPLQSCKTASTNRDKAFIQMNTIAAVGVLTYDMPPGYLKFYRDFTKAVCKGQTKEFFENKSL